MRHPTQLNTEEKLFQDVLWSIFYGLVNIYCSPNSSKPLSSIFYQKYMRKYHILSINITAKYVYFVYIVLFLKLKAEHYTQSGSLLFQAFYIGIISNFLQIIYMVYMCEWCVLWSICLTEDAKATEIKRLLLMRKVHIPHVRVRTPPNIARHAPGYTSLPEH